MKSVLLAVVMVLTMGSALAQPQIDDKGVCASFGKSAMMIGVLKLQGDTQSYQIQRLSKTNIQHTPTGKIIKKIIQLAYSKQFEVKTKDDVLQFGLFIHNDCMQKLTPQRKYLM